MFKREYRATNSLNYPQVGKYFVDVKSFENIAMSKLQVRRSLIYFYTILFGFIVNI